MSAEVTDAPTDALPTTKPTAHPRLPRIIRRLSVPIILGWLAVTILLNVLVPQLDVVGQMRNVSMSPKGAPSTIAMMRVGKDFHEFNSDSAAMIVLEGEQPLGDAAHQFYNELVAKLRADKKHVENVQDFWSDPLTAAGSQSPDGKAAYVQVYLAGNQGEALANESVAVLEDGIKNTPAPAGIKAYMTGAAPLLADQRAAGDRSLKLITGLTFLVIIVTLVLVYRSIGTVLLVLAMVFLELAAARGVVAFLGYHNLIGLSTFAVNLLVMLAIAASTDYAIFLIGRYQEARGVGEDRMSAFYTMYRGTSHVILGSGLTIAGATFCLRFTRLPYFQSLGVPLSIGMLVMVGAALTLGAAVVVVASHFGLLEPKRAMRIRGWRKIGAAAVRWPGPILVATVAVALIGLVALPGYRPGYDDRPYLPKDIPANLGYAAADRHFTQARMNPDLLLVEANHDMRNPTGFLVIDKVAKAVFRTSGIGRVQAITRPLGTPINHASLPFAMSMQGTAQQLNMQYMQDRMKDMLAMGEQMQTTIDSMEKMLKITRGMSETTHSMVTKMHGMVTDIQQLRDHVADFDDLWRPMRSYLYWEKHCFDIPICWSLRSIFDALDGVDTMTDDLQNLIPDLDRLDTLIPQMLTIMPPMIATMKSLRIMQLTMQQTMGGMQDQMAEMTKNQAAMGHAFDEAKNDDTFYLPPEAFDNPDFKRGLKMFLSPDGHAVRMIISHEDDPASSEGISRVEAVKHAVHEAIKGTPLEGSKVYLAGTAPTYKDMATGTMYDLLIAGIASLCLIFIIMLVITRSIIASAVIVGTVLLSLGSAFGLSVLIWQHLVGLDLDQWVLPISMIILLAVGSDYNLLLVARFKEEIHAGLKTGIIRAMGGSGSVVTSAGLVFAFTMSSMVVSDLRALGQIGTTIGLGLLFDTLVVRSFMTPSIAALLGRWFWWPQRVRARPAKPIPTQRQLESV